MPDKNKKNKQGTMRLLEIAGAGLEVWGSSEERMKKIKINIFVDWF